MRWCPVMSDQLPKYLAVGRQGTAHVMGSALSGATALEWG